MKSNGRRQLALADAQFTDPGGDSGGAPDITGLAVTNDAGGNVTFAIRTNQPALAADAGVFVFFDTDKNSATGDEGIEFSLYIDSSGWDFERWDGSKYVAATAPSANASYANGVLTFKLNKADVGGVSSFVFDGFSFQWDEAAQKVVAGDDAPDGTAVYTYTLSNPVRPLTLRASAPVAVPAKPLAGKAFAVRGGVTRGDTGGALASGVAACRRHSAGSR